MITNCHLIFSQRFDKIIYRELNVDIFYNRWGQQGLIDGHWTLDSESISFKPGYEYTVKINKILEKKLNLNDNCLEDDKVKVNNYDYLKCVEMYTKGLLLKNLIQKDKKLCWIPQANFLISSSLISNTSIEACKMIDDMKVMRTELQNALAAATTYVPECMVPCTTEKMVVKSFKSPIYTNDSYIDVYLHWESGTISIEEEYLLMDFSAIVSAVGGSLGLFLGFSCLDFLMQVLNKFDPFLRKLF